MPVKHAFVSAKSDGGDATIVRPSNWNADHTADSVVVTGGMVTASTPVFDATQTWNNSGVTFIGVKMDVTNTASHFSSKLIDLQLGGTSKFKVTRDGNMYVGSSTIYNGPETAFLWMDTTLDGYGSSRFSNSLITDQGLQAGWYVKIGAGSYLIPDASNLIAQRNSTSPQTFQVYNTWTDASNWERGVVDWGTFANMLTVGTQTAGTGTARGMLLNTPVSSITLHANGNHYHNTPTGSGHFFQVNSGDILGVGGSVTAGIVYPAVNNVTSLGYPANRWTTTYTNTIHRSPPVTQTADFTVAAADSYVIINKGSACVVTLPAAASFIGREISFTNNQAFTLASASANVVPRVGGAASTPILAATDGAWAKLVSDGTNWIIVQGTP